MRVYIGLKKSCSRSRLFFFRCLLFLCRSSQRIKKNKKGFLTCRNVQPAQTILSAQAIPVLWSLLLWIAAAEVLGCIIPILQLLLLLRGSESGECRITSSLPSVCAAPRRWRAGWWDINCFFLVKLGQMCSYGYSLAKLRGLGSSALPLSFPTIITSLLGGSLTACAAAVKATCFEKIWVESSYVNCTELFWHNIVRKRLCAGWYLACI